MNRIVEIVPAPPGWYARWRFATEYTQSYPLTVWALLEGGDATTRQVVGVDSAGRWPGSADNEPDADFLHYLYQPLTGGQPADVFNPVRAGARRPGQAGDKL